MGSISGNLKVSIILDGQEARDVFDSIDSVLASLKERGCIDRHDWEIDGQMAAIEISSGWLLISELEAALEALNNLHNGSYGVLFTEESTAGGMTYSFYGDTEVRELQSSDEGSNWYESGMTLYIEMPCEEWAKLTGVAASEVHDYVEYNGQTLVDRLIPADLISGLGIEFAETDPLSPKAEAEIFGNDSSMPMLEEETGEDSFAVAFWLKSSISHAQFLSLQSFVLGMADRFDGHAKATVYTTSCQGLDEVSITNNFLFDLKRFVVLLFDAGENYIGNVRVIQPSSSR